MAGLKDGVLLDNGKYRIEKVIGQGGFGITYLGEQMNLGRKVAIKEFFMKGYCNRDSGSSRVYTASHGSVELVDRFRAKFIKEARNLAKFHHPNIVSVIDVFEDNDTAYYVMEYHSGGSLADKVKNGPLAEPDAVRYIRQAAAALEYIHSMQVMHLDVKPANILLDNIGNAVLIDFGLAKQYDNDGRQTSTTPVGQSHGYAPMEQYKNGGVSEFSPVSDIYSLGATLYKLVTGLTPPDANDVFDSGLPKLPASLSVGVREAIVKSMQPRRSERPQNIGEFLALLGTVAGGVANTSCTGGATADEPTVVVPHDADTETHYNTTVNGAAPDNPVVVDEAVQHGKASGKSGKYLLGLIALLIVAAGCYFVYNNFVVGTDSADSLQQLLDNKSDSTAVVLTSKRTVKTPGDLVMLIADATNSAAHKLENASSAEEVVLAMEGFAKEMSDMRNNYADVIEVCKKFDDEDMASSYPEAAAALEKAGKRFSKGCDMLDDFEYTTEQDNRLDAALEVMTEDL